MLLKTMVLALLATTQIIMAKSQNVPAGGTPDGITAEEWQNVKQHIQANKFGGVHQEAYVKASNTEVGDKFGTNVAISGETMVITASGEDSGSSGVNGDESDNSMTFSGAAYVFVRTSDTWVQEAYLKASNPDAFDSFGFGFVDIDSDTIVIGAASESSTATGVNGNQSDNSALSSGAAYVFVRNAGVWSQQAYLKASNTEAEDLFGTSVAISGDTVIIGAPREDSDSVGVNGNQNDNSALSSGAVYVFTRSLNNWSQQAYLKASNTDGSDQFGSSVAISGNTIAIGANTESSNALGVNGNQADNSAVNSGAVYVFTRDQTLWSQQAYIKSSNSDSADEFGSTLSIDGDTLVVSANREDSNASGINGDQTNDLASNSGAVYVFFREMGVWTQQAYIKASNTDSSDFFGESVDVSGDYIVVSAMFEGSMDVGLNGDELDNSSDSSGAAYVFKRIGNNWQQLAYIKASNTDSEDVFGSSVNIQNNIIIIGARSERSNTIGVDGNQSDNSLIGSGAAYVFDIEESQLQQEYFKASNTNADDLFGQSVAISGNTMVVSAIDEESDSTGVNGDQSNNFAANSGAVYVFVKEQEIWQQQAYLKASNTESFDRFGTSVAISGDTIVVGAALEDSGSFGVNSDQSNNSRENAGAAYVFIRNNGAWQQQAYLKASNTSQLDFFGFSVDISGDYIIVGAYNEDGGAIGVNGSSMLSKSESGAAYIFVRNSGIWTQQAYVKASNTEGSDWFGYSVAIDGETAIVSALSEDGGSSGVNGDDNDNSLINSGAVYAYIRNQNEWSFHSYIKASNSGTGDGFGNDIDIYGNTFVVGAAYEDSGSRGVNSNGFNDLSGNSGAAYVFARGEFGFWSQQAYLKSLNSDSSDLFGDAVSIVGNRILIGATSEDSSTAIINGYSTSADGTNSGAAYLFSRNTGIWQQDAYLKAHNTGNGDTYGKSVVISDNLFAVGANHEDSNQVGIGESGLDNSLSNSGAVYTYNFAPLPDAMFSDGFE